MEELSAKDLLRTSCCAQPICQLCIASHHVADNQPTCPFCRSCDYSARVWKDGVAMLDGTWEVQVAETSPLGKSKHKLTLTLQDGWGMYNNTQSYLEGSTWGDVTMGDTPSGKSFTASHDLVELPSWLQRAKCTVIRQNGVTGRLHGGDSAVFSTTTVVCNAKGDRMEIVHEAQMKRRRRRSPIVSL